MKGIDRSRRGMITVSDLCLENVPELFYRMQFIPYNVDDYSKLGAHIYYGIRPLFDSLKEGALVPEYTVENTQIKVIRQ